jgi:hypothetical protein
MKLRIFQRKENPDSRVAEIAQPDPVVVNGSCPICNEPDIDRSARACCRTYRVSLAEIAFARP